MGVSVHIDHVVVTSRADGLEYRLANYVIHVGNDTIFSNNPTCPGTHDGTATVQCNLEGRYVTVFNPNSYLHLCEVEFFGSPLQ